MADEKKPPQQVRVQIESEPQTRQGVFSNLALISHTSEEFVLDFMMVLAQPPSGRLGSRVLMTPAHAKRFARALAGMIEQYEKRFGPIPDSKGPQPPPGLVH